MVGGGSWAQNSGEETLLALVREACRAAAGLFLSAASLVFFAASLVLAKWIPPLTLTSALRLKTLMSPSYPAVKNQQI